MTINYSLYDPSGNITALVCGKYNTEDRKKIADLIMNNEPSCEQVGFVYYDKNKAFAQLEMTGGEFCGNASMCAAIELFCSLEQPSKLVNISVKCSGYDEIINITVGWHKDDQYFAKLFKKGTEPVSGIDHTVVLCDELPDKKVAEERIKSMEGDAARGLMFLNGRTLIPLVYVPKANTLFWENSCASGCIAVASYLYKQEKSDIFRVIVMPGGQIAVSANAEGITLQEVIKLCRKCTIELKDF